MEDFFNACPDSNISFIHTNIRSLKRNLENFQTHLLDELDFHFSIIGVTETRINSSSENLDFNPSILHYNFEHMPSPLSAGGVGMYIDERFQYQTIERCSNEAFQALFVELHLPKNANIICGVLYRQHNSPERFQEYFDSTMEKLSATGKQIILMGDFNINLLHYHTNTHAQNFILSLQSLNLTPTIDKPTRVNNNSYSLIDNIFINNLGYSICSGNIVSDLTDHFSQFCILNSFTNLDLHDQPKLKRLTRDFSNFSEANFLNELSQVDLMDIVCNKADVNKSFSTFHNKLNKLLNKHAPLKPISKRSLKKQRKPWITKGIRRSIKIKNSLYYSGDIKTYKVYRNKILMLTRISKRNFFHNYFEDNLTNIKKTWEGINNLLGRKRKDIKHITSLKRPGNDQISYNPSELPDIMNNYFSSIGHSLASKMPHSKKKFLDYLLKSRNADSFFFNPVTQTEIESEIMNTPLNKAHGLYSFPTRILRSARHILSHPLSALINMSVEQGIYPSKLKLAKVIPIYKSNDESDPSNYRPISLLSVFNRIFEKMMYNRLKAFLEKFGILHESQYGFREKRSTEHAILEIINQIQTNMDRKLYTCGIFIDLQKAFDTVDHTILLKKLDHYGVRGIVNDWFTSYLTARKQITEIGPLNISKKATVLSGVPQGSVLGPLLFLVYINDICNSCNQMKFYLFADDTNLLYADKNLKSLESTINDELCKLYDWLIANKLSLNIKKSNYVIFRPRQKKVKYEVNLKIFNHHTNSYMSLERKSYVKYLGVLIDENLSWKHHILHIASKISISIGIIARLRHFVPLNTLQHIYRSLIQPYLLYGITAWGRAGKTHRNIILRLQKRALRLMFFCDYKTHAIPLFISSSLLPLDLLYFKSVAILMHDVSNNISPPQINNLFHYQHNIHSYITRSSTRGNFFLKYSRINKQNMSFSRNGVRIWNSLSSEFHQMPKTKFKRNIHNMLLQKLSEANGYIDISDLNMP